MTQHFPTRQLRFFLTAPSPCPYLADRFERKVFAHLPLSDGALVNDSLTQVGFRRSQNIAYRPACESCASCGSPSSIGVLNRPGAIVITRISLSARSRAIGSVMPTTPPLDAE